MCRPEPVSPDSPYADPGPKRLTAALSPSECQPPVTDGSGRRPPSPTAARGGLPEPAEQPPAGREGRPSGRRRQASDQRIRVASRIAGQGVAESVTLCGRGSPSRRRNTGSSAGGIGEGFGRAVTGRLLCRAAAAQAPNRGAARLGSASDDGRKSSIAIGPGRATNSRPGGHSCRPSTRAGRSPVGVAGPCAARSAQRSVPARRARGPLDLEQAHGAVTEVLVEPRDELRCQQA